jgi:hypothetical protein
LLDGLSRRPRRWGRSPGAAVERLHGRGRKRGHPCQELGNSEGRGRCLLLPATPSVVCFAAALFWRSAPPRRRAAPSLGHARDADRRARRSAARLHRHAGEQHRPSATRATRIGELGGAPRVCTRAPASMLAAPPWLRLSRRGAATSLVAGAGRAGRESEK